MKVKKNRVKIDDEISAQVLYASDRTCCVCNERGKAIQIHHIDENPSNNELSNLAVLCFQCHEETQIRGGFGRKLNAAQVMKYREEWVIRVEQRRKSVDELVSLKTIEGQIESKSAEPEVFIQPYEDVFEVSEHEINRFKNYVYKVAEIKKTVFKYATPDLDTGITNVVRQTYYEIIDFYEEILNELASFYPSNHFDGGDSKKYFNKLIATRFHWHRLKVETYGVGNGGTMVHVFVGAAVMSDTNEMIKDIVRYLAEFKFTIDYKNWENNWDIEDE
ncbi:HNH endonuclease [Panacibacter ginsenosidivorans]|uniref:HNH endonuclease n=1 Tax=Panacibacter ginsenosidivorans TaxID=1813871 RepID=A0A5B8V6E8_9BACT|nr:HNH endonuclease signature motif containing protein [Panacibacter ginsenosidivorans]QEC66311.1 HNH endonuclease [Panacibacter ginsenosidivorans]